MANKHVKRCSVSLVIRETHMKIMMKYSFTPIGMARIKKINNNKCLQRCENRTLRKTLLRVNVKCGNYFGKSLVVPQG